MNMEYSGNIEHLYKDIRTICLRNKKRLTFHGWHHISFVSRKSLVFAKELNADQFLTYSSALTHDLNYLENLNSSSKDGRILRSKILKKNNYCVESINSIEQIVIEASLENRNSKISLEAKALSDADTLYKSLPITPIFFAANYMEENHVDLKSMATNIVEIQKPLIDDGEYFYTLSAIAKYEKWAKTNIAIWENVLESLDDKDVLDLYSTFRHPDRNNRMDKMI